MVQLVRILSLALTLCMLTVTDANAKRMDQQTRNAMDRAAEYWGSFFASIGYDPSVEGSGEESSDEIIVTGTRDKPKTIELDSLFANSPMNFSEMNEPMEAMTDEIVVTAKRCEAEKEKVSDAAKNARIVLLGESHDVAINYGSLFDKMGTGSGDCLAIETNSHDRLPASYQSVAQNAANRGMQVHYFDQADGYYQRDSATSGAGMSFLSNSFTNTRDALMANYIKSAMSQCRKIVSINGFNHLFAYDDSKYADVPRVNLDDQLAGESKAKVNLENLENECGSN